MILIFVERDARNRESWLPKDMARLCITYGVELARDLLICDSTDSQWSRAWTSANFFHRNFHKKWMHIHWGVRTAKRQAKRPIWVTDKHHQ
jgi:hypothetical protein